MVGKPTAGVMTSSPAASGRSSRCDRAAATASRLACEPEPTRATFGRSVTPTRRVRNSSAKRPSVSQPSSAASTSVRSSGEPITLPATETPLSPGTNGGSASKAAAA